MTTMHLDEGDDLERVLQWDRFNLHDLGNHARSQPRPSVHSRGIRRTVLLLAKRCLYALVPQIVRTTFFNDRTITTTTHSTSWLNGLRGLAALAVFNEHYLYFFTYRIIAGYGTGTKDHFLHQLPIISLFSDGVTGVVVFFTVAGYTCSYKTLQAITARDHETLFRQLPASVFRRWFRLYLPVICSTLMISMLAYIGAYERSRSLLYDTTHPNIFVGPGDEPQPQRFTSLPAQLADWWTAILQFMNFWTEYIKSPDIDYHLWTIPHEFRGSMHLYIVLVATASCKTSARIFILLFLGYVHVAWFSHWDLICFFYGAAIAQMDVLRRQQSKDNHPESEHLHKRERLPQTSGLTHSFRDQLAVILRVVSKPFSSSKFRASLYALALYLMSFPSRGVRHPAVFYEYVVNPLIPYFYGIPEGPKFPKQFGVLLLIYLLTTVPADQRVSSKWYCFLTSAPCKYLGRIMFGFFLVHGMTCHIFGYAIPHLIWQRFSPDNQGQVGVPNDMTVYLMGLLVGWAVTLVITLLIADVWTREVEGRCIRAAKWLESMLHVKE